MVRTITALTAAGAIAAATLVSVPNKAEAYPVWVIPAIAAGVIGGAVIGATAVNADSYAYSPRAGTVYVQPRAGTTCHIVRERTASGAMRRIQVCE